MGILQVFLGTLAAGVAGLGSLALLGVPLGLAVAWVGSFFANKTVKVLMIGGGLLLLVGTSVGLTIHVQHLERDRVAYKAMSDVQDSLESHYGCPARPLHERALAPCLVAKDRDAAAVMAREITRQRDDAMREQARRDAAEAEARAQQDAAERAIEADAVQGDGPVPDVLLQSWKRERALRGVK